MSTNSAAPGSLARPAGILFTDRVFVAGTNGSGKSILINHIASQFRCQVLLYDTKDEFTVPDVEAVHHPEQIDWDQRVIHLIDDGGDLKETDRLFHTAWERKAGRSGHAYGLIVVVHELGDLCADQPGGTPQWVSVYIRKGRAHGLGLLAGSQRPRNIPRVARSEAHHVMSFAGGFDPEDLPVMAGMHRMTLPEYERALEQAARLGEHSYIWGDRWARTNVIRPALPREALSRTLASGIDPLRRTPENSRELGKTPENSREAGELQSPG